MQQFFEYRISDDINEVIGLLDMDPKKRPAVVGCLNPHSFVVALEDERFHEALVNCDCLLPDGEGICMAMRRCNGVGISKIAGDDIHRVLMEKMEAIYGRVYYMGSEKRVLSLIKERAAREYPSVSVRWWSPSFCEELSEDESRRIVEDINGFAPDVLFVSMTAPKQEKWVEKWRKEMKGVRIVASIGAVFDFYAGTVKRAPEWAVRMKMEWLVRLVKEPRRMWHRNFVSTPRFLRWVRKNKSKIVN